VISVLASVRKVVHDRGLPGADSAIRIEENCVSSQF